jgi:undecaprenyl-diphosphatase
MSPAAVAERDHAARVHPTLKERLEPAAEAWRPLLTAWVGLFLVVTAAGLPLVGPLAESRIAHTDLRIERWLADHRISVVNVLAESLTWLAETVRVPLLCVIAIAIAWRASKNVATPVFLVLAVGGEKLLYVIASVIIGRDRPPVPTVGTSYATSSFPSGHVASTVTLYGSIALVIALERSPRTRALLLGVAGLLAVVVAACRMYSGFHYLSDSVAGATVGALWLTVVYRTVLLPHQRRSVSLT